MRVYFTGSVFLMILLRADAYADSAYSCDFQLGVPWLCAATVRSINHVKALHKYANDGRSAQPGAGKVVATAVGPRALVVLGTTEQRVSGLAIHTAIGAMAVLFRSTLRAVPTPALSGLFLYLGQSALRGNQVSGGQRRKRANLWRSFDVGVAILCAHP